MQRRTFGFVLLTGLAMLTVSAARSGQAGDRISLLRGVKEDVLIRALYSKPERLVHGMAPSGAVGANVAFESGQGDKYYIELQRYGADLVQAGVARKDEALIQQGWKMLDWGFARQGHDGGFDQTGDPFHSASFFVEGAARALLLLKEGKEDKADKFADYERYLPKLKAAAYWLMRPAVITRYRYHNAPYTHRRWLLAAALGETAELLNDRSLEEAAEAYAREGLLLQTGEGVNPEKGGGDVNYQALGILLAGRYYTVCKDAGLRSQIKEMITHGLNWEADKVDAAGEVNAAGSTRVGKEKGRAGTEKNIDYKTIVQAFSLGGYVSANPHYEEIAERIAIGRKWISR